MRKKLQQLLVSSGGRIAQQTERRRVQKRGGGDAGDTSLENLHAMDGGVSHDDAPVAVDGNAATRVDELPVA